MAVEELIKETYERWKGLRDKAVTYYIEKQDFRMARKLSECKLFTGSETFSELVDLMFTPQGTEAILTYKFITHELFKQYKAYEPEKLGVYIDSGIITLTNVNRVFLVGNTTAKTIFNGNAASKIVLMHGAHIDIEVHDYAIAHIEKDETSGCSVKEFGNGLVL